MVLLLSGCTTTSYQYNVADTMCEMNGGLKEVTLVHPSPYFTCNNSATFKFSDIE